MKMLRLMGGMTRKDKIRNEHIRGTTGVAQAYKMITERQLNWNGHAMMRDEELAGLLRKCRGRIGPTREKEEKTTEYKMERCLSTRLE